MQKCDIKIIIDRIDDLSEKVRMEAFQVLSKMHLKQFTIEQRKRLLSNGLYDNNGKLMDDIILYFSHYLILSFSIIFLFRRSEKYSKNGSFKSLVKKNGW